ncbi:hypothetical protein NDU88_003055 [Pleurodeles waltl]|uniref:Uncharacterized protein n=1 Tax=Pleurodeles waltl TaxID=8319 RepID=A0AAV7VGE1_PLEWA|nr:hypothetical protein NDU88_003055 [Pleurodeles waltl]
MRGIIKGYICVQEQRQRAQCEQLEAKILELEGRAGHPDALEIQCHLALAQSGLRQSTPFGVRVTYRNRRIFVEWSFTPHRAFLSAIQTTYHLSIVGTFRLLMGVRGRPKFFTLSIEYHIVLYDYKICPLKYIMADRQALWKQAAATLFDDTKGAQTITNLQSRTISNIVLELEKARILELKKWWEMTLLMKYIENG